MQDYLPSESSGQRPTYPTAGQLHYEPSDASPFPSHPIIDQNSGLVKDSQTAKSATRELDQPLADAGTTYFLLQRVCVCVCVYIYMCVCVCVCVYIYISCKMHTHTHMHAHTHTHTHTHTTHTHTHTTATTQMQCL